MERTNCTCQGQWKSKKLCACHSLMFIKQKKIQIYPTNISACTYTHVYI